MSKQGTTGASTIKSGAEFYARVKKEYEGAAKPFIYEFSLTSEQPRAKKFRIMLGKFIEIFKDGMKDDYRYDGQDTTNYWDQLQKNYAETLQMKYIMKKIYEGREVKIRIYFALLLHNKKLFSFFDSLLQGMGYLYKDIKEKRVSFQKDIAPLSFLKDGQFIIDTNYIQQFVQFREKQVEKRIMMEKEVKLLVQWLVDTTETNIKQYLIEEEAKRLKIQNQKRIKAQEQEKRRQAVIQAARSNKNQIVPINKPSINTPAVSKIAAPPIVTPTPLPPVDIQPMKKRPKHLKNSQHLFDEKFKQELQVFSFREKPEVSTQKTKCFECKQPLSQGFYILGANMNYCNYTGQWFCNEHIADERIQIPHKAMLQFDLRGYAVSKRSYYEIKSFQEKPIIEIKFTDDIVKTSKKLYEFLILKRQIHLMYDSICNSELMQKLLSSRINYCLKRNLFSLKNLYDIYNGHEKPYIEGEYGLLVKHFYKCEICQTKKGRLCGQCHHPPKIFSFELQSAYSCKHCMKIFHRRCLVSNKCSCEQS